MQGISSLRLQWLHIPLAELRHSPENMNSVLSEMGGDLSPAPGACLLTMTVVPKLSSHEEKVQ